LWGLGLPWEATASPHTCTDNGPLSQPNAPFHLAWSESLYYGKIQSCCHQTLTRAKINPRPPRKQQLWKRLATPRTTDELQVDWSRVGIYSSVRGQQGLQRSKQVVLNFCVGPGWGARRYMPSTLSNFHKNLPQTGKEPGNFEQRR
jgi:hypothetical protein